MHDDRPTPTTAQARSVLRAADAQPDLQGQRPDHQAAVLARPALHRAEGRGLPSARPASPTPSYFGPEAEFFVFDDVRFDSSPRGAFYYLDSDEAAWNSRQGGPEPRLQDAPQGRLLPRPADRHARRPPHRDDAHAHGDAASRSRSATTRSRPAGQCEIGMKFATLTRRWPTSSCGSSTSSRTSPGSTARRRRSCRSRSSATTAAACTATSRSGRRASPSSPATATRACRTSASGTSAASSSTPRRSPRSPTRRRTATAASSPASRRRSTSPTRAATARPRSASRSRAGNSPKARRIEVRFPDPSCNPYLAFAAMMMAGLDGIQNRIDPGDPLDKDIYALSPEELKEVPHMPGSLDEALDALEQRPRVPPPRRRLHQGRHRHVDRVQARARARPGPPAPRAVRVLPLLRHLNSRSVRGVRGA